MNRRMRVDLGALTENYRTLKRIAEPSRCAAVVKANAYGLGVSQVATALVSAGCDAFFVATAEEAAELRELTGQEDIFVLEGVDEETVARISDVRAVPVLNTYEEARLWALTAGPAARCILHLDSGMSRLGMSSGDVARLLADERVFQALAIDYVMTHLACADETGHPYNAEQMARFAAMRSRLPQYKTSIANSSAILLDSSYHGDLVRAGIALYGGNPQPGQPNLMREVVRVEGRVIQRREVELEVSVGYGATARVKESTQLATVGFGYADGYPRNLSNKGYVVAGGRKTPVVGRVSMDSLVVDVSKIPERDSAEGSWVRLIGGGVDLDQLAEEAGTISYELLTGIGPRVKREYTKLVAK